MIDPAPAGVTMSLPGIPDLSEPGISLATTVYRRSDGTHSIGVRGVFRYPFLELNEALPNALKLIAIILIVGSDHSPFTFSPGRETIWFEDDIRRTGEDGVGTFQFDLFEASDLHPVAGECFVSAAMGPYVSNVCRVTLSV